MSVITKKLLRRRQSRKKNKINRKNKNKETKKMIEDNNKKWIESFNISDEWKKREVEKILLNKKRRLEKYGHE